MTAFLTPMQEIAKKVTCDGPKEEKESLKGYNSRVTLKEYEKYL